MEITGTLHQIFEPITGQGRNGTWKKQEFLLETPGQYPKKVLISVWGDKINLSSFKPGTQVTVGIDVESREYNGKWYTDVKAWKVVAGASTGGSNQQDVHMPPPPSYEGVDTMPADDLPF
ncbi:MAG: DUF3127 domain-containing protein [Chitinophagaceae bacterium]|nr:DUF3127 domain-containing protein [Chitinophagaceae bacterium]